VDLQGFGQNRLAQGRVTVYLAGVVIRKVLFGILWRDGGQQEGPPFLANAVVIVWPVGWGCLQC